MRLPSLLIIGAPRAGTSTLFRMLQQVPGMWGPDKKEMHYFDNNHFRGLQWYTKLFSAAPKGAMLCEATPSYLFKPHVPERVKEALPDARFVVLLRDPVARAISHFWLWQDRLGTDQHQLMNPKHRAVVPGRYAAHLECWFKCFDRKRFLIFASEAFFEMPAVYARHTAMWAGIHHNVVHDTKFTTTYNDPLEHRKKRFPPPRKIHHNVVQWLQDYYKDHNAALDKLLAPYNITHYWRPKAKTTIKRNYLIHHF